MTASEIQVDKAMYDLTSWQTTPGVFVSTENLSAQKASNMESFSSTGEATPYPDIFTLDNSPSGSTTPYEAITPPNGMEAKVDVEPVKDDIPLCSFEETKLETELVVPVVESPVIETSTPKDVEPVLESTSTVSIRAPPTYDPHAPASTRLRHIIKNSKDILVCPGVYDGLSARIALSLDFKGMYMTGAGTNASRLGMADLGIAHLHE